MSRLEQIRALIADDPRDAMLRFALGNEHFQQEQYAEAIDALKAALDLDLPCIAMLQNLPGLRNL